MDRITAIEPSTFTRDEVEGLKSSLTMLDIYKARKLTKEAVEVGLNAYHQGALRTGVVPQGTTLEQFLGRLRADDFNEIMGAARGLSPLESGGGSERASSSGTDSLPENSSS